MHLGVNLSSYNVRLTSELTRKVNFSAYARHIFVGVSCARAQFIRKAIMLTYDQILLSQLRYREMVAEAEKRAKYGRTAAQPSIRLAAFRANGWNWLEAQVRQLKAMAQLVGRRRKLAID